MPDEFKLEYRYTDWIILCQYGSPAIVLNFSRRLGRTVLLFVKQDFFVITTQQLLRLQPLL